MNVTDFDPRMWTNAGLQLLCQCTAQTGCESLAGNLADVPALTWAESGKLRS